MSKTRQAKPRRKRCDCCRKLYDRHRSSLKGLCELCSNELGGGIHSAAIVRQERMAMKKDGRR